MPVKAAAEIRNLQELFMLQKVETGITIMFPAVDSSVLSGL